MYCRYEIKRKIQTISNFILNSKLTDKKNNSNNKLIHIEFEANRKKPWMRHTCEIKLDEAKKSRLEMRFQYERN